MYTDSLNNHLPADFLQADEIWIAAALMSQAGLGHINGLQAKMHILVGIDLPTPPDVLRELMYRQQRAELNAKVYSNEDFFYHPKVYIIRKAKAYKAYVGSGNFTNGGWGNNIELFWTVEKEADCLKLIEWFEGYFDAALRITQEFIDDYETQIFNPEKDFTKGREAARKTFKGSYQADYQQFFRQEDFDAFAGDRPTNKNEIAKAERKSVKDKLYELHDLIYPEIQNRGWEIYPHKRRANIISLHFHGPFNSGYLDALWLYYGKSPAEVEACHRYFGTEDTPNDHIRLQIIIRHDYVGIWCAVGKDNGSRPDREALAQKLKDTWQRERFYKLVKALDPGYFIQIANLPDCFIRDINSPRELYQLVSQDQYHLDAYFIIGLNIPPSDAHLRDDKIKAFITGEFEKLYPLYLFIKAPSPDENVL